MNATHGRNYTVMNGAEFCECEILSVLVQALVRQQLHPLPDPAAGTSDDWYASQGVRFVYAPELRFTGHTGMPTEDIVPTGEEVWAAWEVILDKLLAEEEAGRVEKSRRDS